MRRPVLLGAPWLAIGGAVSVMVEMGLGAPVLRLWQFALAASVIIWSLIVLAADRRVERYRRQVRYQQQTINAQIEAIGQLQQLLYAAGGRDG